MTDKYIDLDETQIYGPYASRMIRERVVGLVAPFDAGLQKLAEEIDNATAATHEAVEVSRDAAAGVRSVSKDKGSLLKQATSLLGRFSTHLDTHEKGSVDRKTFFPEDGTAAGIGKGAARVSIALGRIITQLKKPTCAVKAKSDWLSEFKAAAKALSPVIEHANNVRTERATATPELEAARKAWMLVYVAAKCGVECVLRLSGNVHLMPVVFYDLAVPGDTKLTAMPTPPPAEPTPA